jgi:immunity protein, SdpI family
MERQLLRSLPAFVLAATVLYTLSVYPELPARMATHWGINGQPNGWSPREIGAWILPVIMAFIWGVSIVIPLLDPSGVNAAKFGTMYSLVITAIVAFQGVVQWAMLSVALGHPLNINTVVYVSLGGLFALLGLGVPSRAAGYLMIIAGASTIYAALTATPQVAFFVMVGSTLAASIGSVLIVSLWRGR